MKNNIILFLAAISMLACNESDRKTKPVKRLELKQVDASIAKLKAQKIHIDSLVADTNKMKVLVKVRGKRNLIAIKGNNYPDDVETTYNLFEDKKVDLNYAVELPFSESGDWFICYKSYFDPLGKLFVFVKQTNSFNSECTSGVIYETQTNYFGNNNKLVDSSYTLVDEKNKPMKKPSCVLNYEYPFTISHSVKEFLTYNRIKVH